MVDRIYTVGDALALINDKWTMRVFVALCMGHCRFGEFQRAIPGITRKMLAQTLRKMVRDGLIERRDFEENPPRVEYSLTESGRTLLDHLSPLCDWAQEAIADVNSARDKFDASD